MAIKVIAQRRVLKIGKNPGVKKFVMRPDLYIPIQEKKVFSEASTHSGISAGVIKAAWDAAGEVLRTWATEGHPIPLPGLGTMRLRREGVRRESPGRNSSGTLFGILVSVTIVTNDTCVFVHKQDGP